MAEDGVLRLLEEHGQSDLADYLLSFLAPPELGRVAGCSKFYRKASADAAAWGPLCAAAWEDKVYVPAALKEQQTLGGGAAREAMRESLADAQRQWITEKVRLSCCCHCLCS